MSPDSMKAAVAISLTHDAEVNYALDQNDVPVIKKIILTNETHDDLLDLTVRVTTYPEFTLPFETNVSRIPAGRSVELDRVDLKMNRKVLAGQTEREQGTLTATIIGKGRDLACTTSSIAILAHDEWSGFVMPEVIAAFVTPSHPYIARIIKRASCILTDWGEDPSLEGYQSEDPVRVRKIVAAIYAAIQEYEVSYAVPPPSFETHGQKIRTPDVIVEDRLATCLDLTCLFAACMEACGINPIIVFVKQHAFVGGWLVDQSFPEPVQDDVSMLSKRIATGVQELCVVETTASVAGKNCRFDDAVTLADNRVRIVEDFHFLVDIRRCRIGQIRPLPSRVKGRPIDDADGDGIPDGTHAAPDQVDSPVRFVDTPCMETEHSRLDQWERRLLDLSLNNALLNYRMTQSGLELMSADVGQLENSLADGVEFEIHPRPAEWTASFRNTGIFEERRHTDLERAQLEEEFRARRLRTNLTATELAPRLTQIFRSARTSLEENGANTLYLAVGMLGWFPIDDKHRRFAPLILLPVELTRKTMRAGFVLRQREEEPIFNITLLEMIRQDFGIDITSLNELPHDDSGIDVKTVMTIMRRAVMNNPGWDVIENACLGLFSFNKFVMWHDLRERSEDLKKNDVVRSLMAGSVQFEQPATDCGCDLDEACGPSGLMCPISADSSQLEAIEAVAKGRNLILHGPPGTGKSQTITNMIANALAHGRTVLFVAEKMAALSVVQRRLEGIGLGPFCLELHSNKSRKTEVLAQLGRSLNTTLTRQPDQWEVEAETLRGLRQELNHYVDALHRTRGIGHSVFNGLGRLCEVAGRKGVVRFDPAVISAMTADGLSEWTRLAHDLGVAASTCGRMEDHPLKGCRRKDFTPNVRQRLTETLNALSEANNSLQKCVGAVYPGFFMLDQNCTLETLQYHSDLFQIIAKRPPLTPAMALDGDIDSMLDSLRGYISLGRERQRLRLDVLEDFEHDVLEIQANEVIRELRTLSQQWALPRWLGRRRIAKLLASYLKPESTYKVDIDLDIANIRRLTQLEQYFRESEANISPLLKRLWKKGDANWNEVEDLLPLLSAMHQVIEDVAAGNQSDERQMRKAVARFLDPDDDSRNVGTNDLQNFIESIAGVDVLFGQLVELFQMDPDTLKVVRNRLPWFQEARTRLQNWEHGLEHLRDWCSWNRVRDAAVAAGLGVLVECVENGSVPTPEVEPAFVEAFYSTWVEEQIANDTVLSQFSRVLFEDKINKFRKIDEQWADLSCREIYARLAARVPRGSTDLGQKSELGILGRELQKQRAHMALRILFQKIPNLLVRLKPCMLMSPISVAQYLDPSFIPFDLVIFDEASQVPTCDAVGAIARGKQVVIVGDPKQLPPTTFFSRGYSEAESDDEQMTEDLESVLDDCLAIRLDQRHLLWHYRSRHESLIAFCNTRYYENRLMTFPSPDDLTRKVRLIQVEGRYERGHGKHNLAEAQAVVHEIVRRLKDPILSGFSIGIVTFNQPQQKLIEDMLDEQIRRTPALEKLVSEGLGEHHEQIFVKNLENVQGDERDVILFSIGYGPDKAGRISMNFGPINKEGGQRRLNVAVSRARHEMIVFSSIRPEQIDTSRTMSRGVADLKAFLEYAERGQLATREEYWRDDPTIGQHQFEKSVRDALEARGHSVKLKVGTSGYRVDIGIIDKKDKGRYILGVICDGASYRDARTARDRDKLRESVLLGLGWSLIHVWSTDWWENPERELRRIEQAIDETRRTPPDASPDVPSCASQNEPAPATPAVYPMAPVTGSTVLNPAVPYRVYNVRKVSGGQDYFFMPASIPTIRAQAIEITEFEGPISQSLLARKLAQAWGFSKTSRRMMETVELACKGCNLNRIRHGESVWYWPTDKDPSGWRAFRVPDPETGFKLDPEDLPPEEIANAIRSVLSQQLSMDRRSLGQEVSRLLGYGRFGSTIEECFNYAVELAVKDGDVTLQPTGMLVWAGDRFNGQS